MGNIIMSNEIKKYKMCLIQTVYNKYSTILLNIQEHITNLENNYLLNTDKINNLSDMIYNLIKKLNEHYNNNISFLVDNNNTDIELFYNTINDKKYMPEIIKKYGENLHMDIFFNNIHNDIMMIIKEIGYNDLINMLELITNNKLPQNTIYLLNEINDIVIPISYDIFSVSNDNEYYWRIPNNYTEEDLLQKTRELWIKIPTETNKYIKICLIFKIDKFSNIMKTCQINRQILYLKKMEIINRFNNSNNININFVKNYLRYNYLGDIYCYDIETFHNNIIEIYYKYSKLVDTTFINLMKEFVSESSDCYKMFKIIFLLLLGTNDTADIACLLIGLLKEKKNNMKFQIYNLFEDNLTFNLQNKIKKINMNIKNELENIKTISNENIDFKKQLVINKNIPNNVKSLILEKIEEMKTFNNEYYKQLTYVKTVLNYPWPSSNDDVFFNLLNENNNDAKEYLLKIENKLKTLCYGHDEAKKSLLQIIGKWISNPDSQGGSLGLVGPPGVGKTLLAKSIGDALDIPFGQITLGGQNDGELLHGHGYTYSGSQPGMIVKKMVEMGKSRCILYFDELDKACSKHGQTNEITSILIHLTDPNMNKNFQDRFFQGIDFPLNKVIIIFSYNDSSLIDPILLDRIKEIKVSPYTSEDKLKICQEFVIPEAKKNIGNEYDIIINNNLLEYIISNYTNEAGVRGIKRKIEEIFLNLNIDKIYKRNLFKTKKNKILLTKNNILPILNEPNDHHVNILNTSQVGIINGLYATTIGDGGIIQIQIFPNIQNSCDKYEIKLTGKQGETMKESVICSLTAAIEYLKNNKEKYNIYDLDKYMEINLKYGFHIHTPSTSTPKDGPSAGCAFTCAFISRILNKPIKNDIAMTGEIELTGKVTKIGGLEYKLQGAKKAGVKTVYVSSENEGDINTIKKKYKNLITKEFNVKIFSNINEIIDEILIL
jgi:ATP-dependent Lon protease